MRLLATLLIGLGGAIGAPSRSWVDGMITVRLRGRRPAVPPATLVINASGSLLLGVLTGLAAVTGSQGPPLWLLFAGTGFCGGFTTFSTASVEAARLVLEGRVGAGAATAAAHLLVCGTCAVAGLALASVL